MGLFKRENIWQVEFTAPDGRRVQRSLRTGDRKLAEIKVGALRRGLELRDAGIETHDATRRQPVAELAAEYLAELRRIGRDEAHVQALTTKVGRMLEGATRLEDVTPEHVRASLVRVTARFKLAPQTANQHRTALHGFFSWLVKLGRWSRNPVEAVAPSKVVSKTFERRAFRPEELERLVQATAEPRATVYRLAATTGLRRAELRALRWKHVDLDGATLTLPGKHSKNRKDATLPVAPNVVGALRAIQGKTGPEDPVFRLKNGLSAVPHMPRFYADLEAAGIAVETPDGVVDFHALRATFCTSLARSGTPLTLAQRLMRHSTPLLTANVYTKLELHDARAAVARVDLPTASSPVSGVQGKSQGAKDGKSPEVEETRGSAGSARGGRPTRATLAQAQAVVGSGDVRESGGTADTRVLEARRDSLDSPSAPKTCDDAPTECRDFRRDAPRHGSGAPAPATDPEALARALLLAAATAPDPGPLLAAAQALLDQAGEARKAAGILRLRRDGSSGA